MLRRRWHGALALLRGNHSTAAIILEGFFARLGFGVITFALPF